MKIIHKKRKYMLFVILALVLTGCNASDTPIVDKITGQTIDSTVEQSASVVTDNNMEDENSENDAEEVVDTTTASEEETNIESTAKEEESVQASTDDVTTPATSEQITKPTTTESTTKLTESDQTTKLTTTPSTTKPTASEQTATEATTQATTEKYVMDYGSEESSITEDYKYGLKKLTITTSFYRLYSDGSKEVYDIYDRYQYDSSEYAATDDELMEESLASATAYMEYYLEVLELVNEIRAEASVQPLELDETLCKAATMRSVEMNYSQQFSHGRPNGETCFSVFKTFSIDYMTAGENIAAGYGSPEDVVNGWKNSPGHYANMINASFNKLGVGLSKERIGYGNYWTQLFTD